MPYKQDPKPRRKPKKRPTPNQKAIIEALNAPVQRINASPGRKKMFSPAEEALVTEAVQVAAANPSVESEKVLDIRMKALGVALQRSNTAIRGAIERARDRIASRAEEYVDLHMSAARTASTFGDAGPSQWALERLTAPGDKGKTIRVVTPLRTGGDEGQQMPTINIGVALGGIAPGAAMKVIDRPALDGDVEEEP